MIQATLDQDSWNYIYIYIKLINHQDHQVLLLLCFMGRGSQKVCRRILEHREICFHHDCPPHHMHMEPWQRDKACLALLSAATEYTNPKASRCFFTRDTEHTLQMSGKKSLSNAHDISWYIVHYNSTRAIYIYILLYIYILCSDCSANDEPSKLFQTEMTLMIWWVLLLKPSSFYCFGVGRLFLTCCHLDLLDFWAKPQPHSHEGHLKKRWHLAPHSHRWTV